MSRDEHHEGAGLRATRLWEALTGKRVDSKSYSFSPGGSFSLYDANKRIQEAAKTGNDAILTLIIRGMVDRYAQSVTFSLAEFRNGSSGLLDQMRQLDQLGALFEGPDCQHIHQEFFEYAESSLAFYREKPRTELAQETKQFIASEGGRVGLDAMHAMVRLTKLMICDGTPAPASTAKLSRMIFVIDRIEDLLTHAHQIPTGFSLCAIRGENISDSYFVLIVRTGGRIIAVTDKGQYQHPLQQERMHARNDRYNAYRIEGSHFPYSILNIVWSDSGRRAGDGGARTEIADPKSGLSILASLSDLDDQELLWLQLFIDQCKVRYFDQGMTEPLLASGSMLRLPHSLGDDNSDYPVTVSGQLQIDIRSSVDLNSTFLYGIEPSWKERKNPNQWMEERFASQVPNDCLYIPETVMLAAPLMIDSDEKGELVLTRGEASKGRFIADLKPIPSDSLATSRSVIADAHYIARHNQVEIIKGLVKQDYENRMLEVQKWFYQAAKRCCHV